MTIFPVPQLLEKRLYI